jgi:YCII-related domain-containing protein
MTYTDDSDLPAITDDQLRQALTEIRPYTIVILKAGPKFEMPDPDRSSEVAKLIWAHGKRNYALRAAGVMPIVCPIADGSGVTGVSIFDADPAEVEKIMAADPGVQAGVFTYDIHPTRGFPGSALP